MPMPSSPEFRIILHHIKVLSFIYLNFFKFQFKAAVIDIQPEWLKGFFSRPLKFHNYTYCQTFIYHPSIYHALSIHQASANSQKILFGDSIMAFKILVARKYWIFLWKNPRNLRPINMFPKVHHYTSNYGASKCDWGKKQPLLPGPFRHHSCLNHAYRQTFPRSRGATNVLVFGEPLV